MSRPLPSAQCFFFNDPATTEIYTLSLHDALPIWLACQHSIYQLCGTNFLPFGPPRWNNPRQGEAKGRSRRNCLRSEEHTSELQSHVNLVCRLLLEKKKKNIHIPLRIRPTNGLTSL